MIGLIAEFKMCIHSDVCAFINEQKAETLEEASVLADDYSLTHEVVFEEKSRTFSSPRYQNSLTTLGNHQKNSLNQKETYGCGTRLGSTPFSQNKPAMAGKLFDVSLLQERGAFDVTMS